jgi:hypothetical protein
LEVAVKSRSLLLLGIFALALGAWVVTTITFYAPVRLTPSALTIGSAFEGTAQLPKEEMTRHLDKARARMLAINEHGEEFSVAGDVCGWLAFACTALITIMAGYFGRPPATDPGAPVNTGGLPPGPTRTVALLAAFAAVLTAGGNLAINRGHDDYAKADRARAIINQTVANLATAKDEREARDVLDNLDLQIERL